jgi:putative flippase GtrA
MFSFLRFRIVRFVLAGGVGAFIHAGTVYLLTETFFFSYLLATSCGFLLAIGVSFMLQKFWTFRDTDLRTKTIARQSRSYALVGFLNNFILNGALMYLLVEILNIWPTGAQLVTSLLIAIVSYILYSLIFKKDRTFGTTIHPQREERELYSQ